MRNIILLGLVLLTGCSVVGPGERGVRISLGKASNEALPSGAYLWVPFFYGMTKLDMQIQKDEVETSAASKDLQEITTKVAVNWSLSPDKIVETYRTIGDEDAVDNRIIDPAVSEVVKSTTAGKTAEEILTKRIELKNQIDTALRNRLAQYGVIINDISITNLAFSPEFMKAVERKQIAEQKAKEAEYDALRATKEADSEVNRAKGQAEAQKLLRTSTSPELLKLKYLEKWDGKLPTIMTGGQNGLMLNVNELTK